MKHLLIASLQIPKISAPTQEEADFKQIHSSRKSREVHGLANELLTTGAGTAFIGKSSAN